MYEFKPVYLDLYMICSEYIKKASKKVILGNEDDVLDLYNDVVDEMKKIYEGKKIKRK